MAQTPTPPPPPSLPPICHRQCCTSKVQITKHSFFSPPVPFTPFPHSPHTLSFMFPYSLLGRVGHLPPHFDCKDAPALPLTPQPLPTLTLRGSVVCPNSWSSPQCGGGAPHISYPSSFHIPLMESSSFYPPPSLFPCSCSNI